ncbi:hypothetical protein AS189_15200 [Arthrobacter alpinus]|uniref:Uncharacterized protein n=1 Tax=Arthrobacter alpinus TaxID=656366 RepID=A0A0S2M1V8_9MICC|nr:hypothetical protein [Arthrobacter alpinus]ALO67590.1 hypothetical protein AS189_15200 [Arthrobacter alpinus]
MTNTNSPAEPTPSNPAAGTTAAAVTGKPFRKAPRRATSAAGAPLATSSPAPALLVIDASGMIVPPPVAPAPESPNLGALDSLETFDAGTAPSPDAAAIDVLETDGAPVEPETVIAAETAAEDAVEAEPTPLERKSEPAEAQTPLDADTVTTAADGADAGTEANNDADAGTDTALVVEEKIAAEEPDKAVPAEVVAAERTGVEPGDDMATSTQTLEAGVPDSERPDSEVSVEGTAPSDATLSDPDSIADTQATTDAAVATASESDAADTDTVESVPAETDTAAAPISRRERRLAEQQAENGGAPVAALSATENVGGGSSGPDDTDADSDSDSDNDSQESADSTQRASAAKSKPRTKRNRFVAAIRGCSSCWSYPQWWWPREPCCRGQRWTWPTIRQLNASAKQPGKQPARCKQVPSPWQMQQPLLWCARNYPPPPHTWGSRLRHSAMACPVMDQQQQQRHRRHQPSPNSSRASQQMPIRS